MNILILTPIHPTQIVELGTWLNKFRGSCDLYSVQTMALLGEGVVKHDYLTLNYIFALETRARPNLIKTKNVNYGVTIVYGNLAKDTPIHFDHILQFSTMGDEEVFDTYLREAANERYNSPDIPGKDKITWYTPEDAHMTIPTYHHLEVFLTTAGAKINDGV